MSTLDTLEICFQARLNGVDRQLDALIGRLSATRTATYESKRLPPLFSDRADYDRFLARHAEAKVARADISTYRGNCYLGIDAGSTTTKLVLITPDGALLYT